MCTISFVLILTSMVVSARAFRTAEAVKPRYGLSLSACVEFSGFSAPERVFAKAWERIEVVEHKATAAELEKLKQRAGVWQEGVDYNQLFGGHGTGLRPPTEEEWEEIAENLLIVDGVDLPFQPASVVDHSAEPWFPPIGDQDGEGSCTCWAVGYYLKTYQEALEHGWNVSEAEWEGGYYGYPTPAYQDRIVSPDFIYHLVNGGADEGSHFYDAIQLVCFIGACSWEKMPYNPYDSTSWPSEEAWAEAPLYRGNSSGYEYMPLDSDAGLDSLKNLLASNNLAVIGVNASQYESLTDADFWTLDNYVDPGENHANTIVGYDDTIEYTEDGETRQGAFKIANSWGVGDWEKVSDGYYWISYEAMKQRVDHCYFYLDMVGYSPELAATFMIDHLKRDECDITIGLGNSSSPIVTKSFSDYMYQEAHNNPFCANNIVLDITEFKDSVPSFYSQSFFISVYDWGWPVGSSTTGTILYFAVDDTVSSDPPVATVNGDYVLANLTLPPEQVIYIRPDGSVDPSTVPIVRDGDLYTFAGNVTDYNGIVIERSNMVLDGAGYLFDGGERAFHNGVTLEGRENVTIKNMIIEHFAPLCVYLNCSSNNFILANNISSSSRYGGDVMLESSCNNLISGNNITDSYQYYDGVCLSSSSNNNSIIGNNIRGHCPYQSGVGVYSSSDNRIVENNITDNAYGVTLDFSSNNSVIWNNMTGNYGGGVRISGGNNTVFGNCIANSEYGITALDSSGNIISGNSITGSYYCGIEFAGSSNNSIMGNNMLENAGFGVRLRSSFNNSVVGNSLEGVDLPALFLEGSSNNTMAGNVVTGGAILYSSSNNTLSGNNVTESLGLFSSYGSKFFHNNFEFGSSSMLEVSPSDCGTLWDDGYPSGGNYWDDYAGVDLLSGLYQNETGADGVGDTPYVIDANNTDHYPLMNPWPDTTAPTMSVLSPQNTTHATSSVPLTFTINEAASWIGYSLDNQANVTIAGNTTLTGLALGTHNVIVYANDTYGNMGSSDRIYFTIAVRDIAVTNVTTSKNAVGQGYSLSVNVTVANQGDSTEAFNLTVYCNETAITMPNGKNYTTMTLESGNSTTLSITWNTTEFDKGNYTITAYAEPVPDETDTTDNNLTDGTVYVGIPGDVEGNLIVNMLDLYKIALNYGKTQPYSSFEVANCDIDNNGIINMLDLYIAAIHFGQTDP